MSEQVTGRVAGPWRYPVQSMQGEPLEAANLTETGIPGGRLWGVLNPAENKVAAAARGKKPWRDLIQWQARLKREPSAAEPLPPVMIRLPDGGRIDAEASDCDTRISGAIGSAIAAEIDKFAASAIALNAALNGVSVPVTLDDMVGMKGPWDLVLAGDVCYERPMAERVTAWLRTLVSQGTEVLLAILAAATCRRAACSWRRATACRPRSNWKTAPSARR